jgi:tRNA pseudouridine55 synthase
MVTLETLQEAKDSGGLPAMLLPIDVGLLGWPRVDLDSDKRGKFKHGQQFPVPDGESNTGKVRVYGPDDDVLGLAEITLCGELKPSRVFNL